MLESVHHLLKTAAIAGEAVGKSGYCLDVRCNTKLTHLGQEAEYPRMMLQLAADVEQHVERDDVLCIGTDVWHGDERHGRTRRQGSSPTRQVCARWVHLVYPQMGLAWSPAAVSLR